MLCDSRHVRQLVPKVLLICSRCFSIATVSGPCVHGESLAFSCSRCIITKGLVEYSIAQSALCVVVPCSGNNKARSRLQSGKDHHVSNIKSRS